MTTAPHLAPLSRFGEPVTCEAPNRIPLSGTDIAWLVAGGILDLFAADRGGHGRWHFLGQASPGTVIAASAPGSRDVLVARPGPGCALRRLHVPALRRAHLT